LLKGNDCKATQLQQVGNIMPYQGQRYRLTYPEKNTTWWSPVPDNHFLCNHFL
jgi:hypothetical protein